MNKPFEEIRGVSHFNGIGQSGGSACVMGSIHGNERIGAAVLEELKKILAFVELKTDVYLILGNPEAYARDVRFVDIDMNRLFGADRNINQPGKNIEEKRVAEIAPVLAKSHYLLDLHSTIKPSVPFAYCEPDPAHLDLASILNTPYVVSPSANFRPDDLVTSADNFVDRHGGLGFTFESGWHRDPLVVNDVLLKAKLFLQKTGACDFGLSEPKKPSKSKRLTIYNHVIPQSTYFTFAQDFSNFDTVANGETIGTDDGKNISAERDSFIIFPKKDIQKGKVACYLAHVS